jgi:LacI family transcriptional regulator
VRSPTLDDVGRAAGVSKTTVAAVLNHDIPSWSLLPETRERVVAAAAKLQYRPNAVAQALANRRMHSQRIHALGVVIGGEFNDYFFEIISGVIAAASSHSQNTTIVTLKDWNNGSARLHALCDGRVDGVILIAPTFDRSPNALPELLPFVSIHANCPIPGIVNIESDEERGAYILVEHLITLGHRRIMHLAGPGGLVGAERRIQGYQSALNDAGIPFDPRLQLTAGYTTERGRDAMCCWLQRHTGEPLPHAVFCANDACALGALEAFAEIGVRAPDDVSVAGFDDAFTARVSVPQLTSVRQPLAEMGARAVELLLARVDGRRVASRAVPLSIVFPVALALRASVGAPPTANRFVPAMTADPSISKI